MRGQWGFVNKLSPPPIRTFGNTGDEGQQEWILAPYSASFQNGNNPFANGDADGVIVNNEIIKIRSTLGSLVNLPFPEALSPSSYSGFLGWLLRGFGLDPIIADFEKEFGVPLTPQEPPKPLKPHRG
jgi:hypothetical protein